MKCFTSAQILQMEKEKKTQSDATKLKALVILSNAFDGNKIQARNLQRIEEKSSSSVFDYIKESRPSLQMLLHEEVEAYSSGLPHMRELPVPPKTFWDNKKGLKPVKEKGACDSDDLRHTPLTE